MFENIRKARKLMLAELYLKEKDLPEEKIIAIFSQRTGLSHGKILQYIIELEAEGQIERR